HRQHQLWSTAGRHSILMGNHIKAGNKSTCWDSALSREAQYDHTPSHAYHPACDACDTATRVASHGLSGADVHQLHPKGQARTHIRIARNERVVLGREHFDAVGLLRPFNL